MQGFVPRSKRGTPAESHHLALQDGVPDHLRPALVDWVKRELIVGGIYEKGYSLTALRGIELNMRDALGYDVDTMVKTLLTRMNDPDWFLDLIDYLLHNPLIEVASAEWPPDRAVRLQQILLTGGSAWEVVKIADLQCKLERRVDLTVEAAVVAAETHNPTAGPRRRAAWDLAYGRSPDAGTSYGESIKAVEVATIAVVSPKHGMATLGKVIGEMKANPTKWTVGIPATSTAMSGSQLVVAMLDALWTGQVGRHGSPSSTSTPTAQSPEEARAAVHLAATLVQWFSSGVIR